MGKLIPPRRVKDFDATPESGGVGNIVIVAAMIAALQQIGRRKIQGGVGTRAAMGAIMIDLK